MDSNNDEGGKLLERHSANQLNQFKIQTSLNNNQVNVVTNEVCNSSNEGKDDSVVCSKVTKKCYSDILPTYEDFINMDNKQTSDDTIETLDVKEKEKKFTRLSAYDPRNTSMWKEIDGDKAHILVLFFLYVLQGIPLGLSKSIPLVLQERGVDYTEQSIFSFAKYPFSMKILWAPIVDALFVKKFGRRKTWLIPTQMLIGEFKLI